MKVSAISFSAVVHQPVIAGVVASNQQFFFKNFLQQSEAPPLDPA
jgi:hypothetical protein